MGRGSDESTFLCQNTNREEVRPHNSVAPQDVLECFSQVRRVLRLLNADFLLRPVTATDELIAVSNLCDTNSPPMQELLMLERAEGEFAAAALSI